MTEFPRTPGTQPGDIASGAARREPIAAVRARPRRRHPAQGARIAAVGLGATTMAGLVGVMGYLQPVSPQPKPPTNVSVVTYGRVRPGETRIGGAVSTRESAANTTLTARPSVRPAPAPSQAPVASTSGSS